MNKQIQIISAPSILGLRPTGVEGLAQSLIDAGLNKAVDAETTIKYTRNLNSLYSNSRDGSHCLNSAAIRLFSESLAEEIQQSVESGYYPLVLGGDCSILIGIMAGLKRRGNYGLIFFDAHADFYLPEQSPTGEVADMELAIITGRGPDVLTDLFSQMPYVQDESIIHLGQRDWEETRKYGAEDIRETMIKCLSSDEIEKLGKDRIINQLSAWLHVLKVDGYWIHLDADVLSDEVNPAVDYRLPGGMTFELLSHLLGFLLTSRRSVGISITILNPKLDHDGAIVRKLTECLRIAFKSVK